MRSQTVGFIYLLFWLCKGQFLLKIDFVTTIKMNNIGFTAAVIQDALQRAWQQLKFISKYHT